MNFTIEIGDKEKSKVEFSHDSFTGSLEILVNGQRVLHQNWLSPATYFSLTLKRHYKFKVGKVEKHKVVIEKERPLLFAPFRPQTYRVFVDGQQVHEQSGR
jgi:Fas apoptotic inhibitory molecule (FAIM1)